MKQAKIVTRIDLKQTLVNSPEDEELYIPIKGFTVNTVRSTAARLNADGNFGKFAISEDYLNKRIIFVRRSH